MVKKKICTERRMTAKTLFIKQTLLFGQLSASFISSPMHEAAVLQGCRVLCTEDCGSPKSSKREVVHSHNAHAEPKSVLIMN